jgi:RNA-directed DNA polymerase
VHWAASGKHPLEPMMNGMEESDSSIVPTKPTNKTGKPAAEPVEGSDGTKRNASLQSTNRTQCRGIVSQAQARIREAVTRNKTEKLTALLHHITVDSLRYAFLELKRNAAPGVDGKTWEHYGEDLDRNLTDLHRRVQAGAYRAQPSRRKYIPKPDGKQRPLGIAALEDKIVQGAVVAILTPIYEAEFLGFSYGFRPGRSQHQALDALYVGITRRKVNWVLDADIARFFDAISHKWLIAFLEHRIGDRRIIRLIQKWLKAGVMEDGRKIETDEGTPQGAVISPLLANIYLHYTLDLWAEQWRRRQATGDMVIVRYADDSITGFQHRQDAERFLLDLQERLARFALSLHPDKTRLIEFGRFAAGSRRRRGDDRPETFDFLGFTHFCDRRRKDGSFVIGRQTKRGGRLAKLREIKEELRARMNRSIDSNGRWLGAVLRGHYAYYGVPRNTRSMQVFYAEVSRLWFKRLRRRGARHRLTWKKMKSCIKRYLPPPRIVHPWPSKRFDVKGPCQPNLRWEPYARIGPVRI